jgi:hypothetical protein
MSDLIPVGIGKTYQPSTMNPMNLVKSMEKKYDEFALAKKAIIRHVNQIVCMLPPAFMNQLVESEKSISKLEEQLRDMKNAQNGLFDNISIHS